jgi:hypothetical protein
MQLCHTTYPAGSMSDTEYVAAARSPSSGLQPPPPLLTTDPHSPRRTLFIHPTHGCPCSAYREMGEDYLAATPPLVVAAASDHSGPDGCSSAHSRQPWSALASELSSAFLCAPPPPAVGGPKIGGVPEHKS